MGGRECPKRGVAGRIGAAIVNAIYPPRCAGCGRRGYWVCPACDATVPRWRPPWCPRCGAPDDLALCTCHDLPATLAAIRSAAPYAGWVREAVIAFKYEGEWARADGLGEMIADGLGDLGLIDALVPVPLHPDRERRRGYNQAALLARHAGCLRRVPIVEALVRVRATRQQVGLGAAARRANVEEAFAVRPGVDVRGLRLVLVDDVRTTGATLGACAGALLVAGASEVAAVTVAREG